jgi:hypothetical protein
VGDERDQGQLRVRCVCGWETIGNLEQAVSAAIDHGQRVHNMTATREAVLATAEWLDPTAEQIELA